MTVRKPGLRGAAAAENSMEGAGLTDRLHLQDQAVEASHRGGAAQRAHVAQLQLVRLAPLRRAVREAVCRRQGDPRVKPSRVVLKHASCTGVHSCIQSEMSGQLAPMHRTMYNRTRRKYGKVPFPTQTNHV